MADRPARFVPLSADDLLPFYHALSALCRVGAHELTPAELTAVLPPRGPIGCYQNKTRGHVIKTLNRAGFTFKGLRLQ